MIYKNECIIISEQTKCKVNEGFDEYLNIEEYFIFDIEKLAQDIGNKIIKRYDSRKKDEGYHKIEDLIEFELKELKQQLIEETEQWLDNNWE